MNTSVHSPDTLPAAAGMAGVSPVGPRPTNTVGAMAHTAGVADGWLHVGIADGMGVWVVAPDAAPNDGMGV